MIHNSDNSNINKRLETNQIGENLTWNRNTCHKQETQYIETKFKPKIWIQRPTSTIEKSQHEYMYTKSELTIEHSIYLSIEKMTINVSVPWPHLQTPAYKLKIINQWALEHQQICLARLPYDHDFEADSVLGRGGN